MNAHDEMADFESHHIEGHARVALDRGDNGYFKVPLISEVLPGLWQGGCKHRVDLPHDFDLVVSLYQSERYAIGPKTLVLNVEAYDSTDGVPDVDNAVELAYWAWKQQGLKVLIHCQAGLNRSGFTAAQVLMRDGYSPADAIALLREKRCDMVLCNATFERWLRDQERRENCACGSYCTDGVCTAQELGCWLIGRPW